MVVHTVHLQRRGTMRLIASVPELLPGFAAGTAAFIILRKRNGSVNNDIVALVVSVFVLLGSLLFGSPVPYSAFCSKLTAMGIIALNALVATVAAIAAGYGIWFLFMRERT